MNKHSYLIKFFKKLSFFINNIIIKNSKKLNLKEKKVTLLRLINTTRIFVGLILILISIFSYLSLPILYNVSKLQDEIKNQLLKRYEIKFIFSTDMKYNLFPWPSYTFDDVQILDKDNKIFAEIKNFKINLELSNFFSVKSLTIKDIFLTEAKFDIYKKDLNFFFNLLDNDFSKSKIKIFDSYVFFKDNEEEILLINKIKQMKYYYDPKKLQNILNIKNEIFNIPYSIELYNNKKKKIIYSKVNINILKSLFEIEHDYSQDQKKGIIKVNNNKNKSQIDYNIKNNELIFEFLDIMNDANFNYKGTLDFKPFYLDLSGKIKKIDINYFTNPNSILIQFLKTEIFNNKNLNIGSNINAKKILPLQKLIDLFLNIKIKEGLIDIDNSRFSWSDCADFKISDSLVYLSNNNLLLDGKLKIDIKNYNEIYKFFQTPRNYRKEVRNLELVFNYNFDLELLNISDLKIDNKKNKKVSEILKSLVSQENVLQNRVYLKNLINKAIKAYAG